LEQINKLQPRLSDGLSHSEHGFKHRNRIIVKYSLTPGCWQQNGVISGWCPQCKQTRMAAFINCSSERSRHMTRSCAHDNHCQISDSPKLVFDALSAISANFWHLIAD